MLCEVPAANSPDVDLTRARPLLSLQGSLLEVVGHCCSALVLLIAWVILSQGLGRISLFSCRRSFFRRTPTCSTVEDLTLVIMLQSVHDARFSLSSFDAFAHHEREYDPEVNTFSPGGRFFQV